MSTFIFLDNWNFFGKVEGDIGMTHDMTYSKNNIKKKIKKKKKKTRKVESVLLNQILLIGMKWKADKIKAN